MITHPETPWQGGALQHGDRAIGVELEDLAAAFAGEVIVMIAPGTLEAGRLVGQMNGADEALGLHSVEIAVDRSQTEAAVIAGGALQHLLWC